MMIMALTYLLEIETRVRIIMMYVYVYIHVYAYTNLFTLFESCTNSIMIRLLKFVMTRRSG